MSPLFPLLLLALAALPHPGEAAAASFPATVQAGETRLVKVGEGSFRWMFFRVYNGSLYLDESQTDADPLSDVAKRLELAYTVGISAEDFRLSGTKFLEKASSPEEMARLLERLERINAAYRPVQSGDRYSLTYLPGHGTTLAFNGDPLVTIEGADFAQAYFSIWLGANPVKRSFQRDLLGS